MRPKQLVARLAGQWQAHLAEACPERTLALLDVLHSTHMETIGVRDLQQHASAALRRVRRGESLGVTDRGRLVAVLSPPSAATGVGALVAAGRVQPARRPAADLPAPVPAKQTTAEVLDDIRAER